MRKHRFHVESCSRKEGKHNGDKYQLLIRGELEHEEVLLKFESEERRSYWEEALLLCIECNKRMKRGAIVTITANSDASSTGAKETAMKDATSKKK